MDIVLATRNRKKIEEIKKILALKGGEFRIFTPDDFPACREVEENGKTFEANAVKKATYFYSCSGMTAIADDSGLEVTALGGAPGVLSARYAGEGVDDSTNTRKLLRALEGVPVEERGARFFCCIAIASSSGVHVFTGQVKGRIGSHEKGERGFGYDPVFYPEGHAFTFAQMSDEEKNSISHRAEALKKLERFLLDENTG
jgi:XTP/dITP diphosphohydrolase